MFVVSKKEFVICFPQPKLVPIVKVDFVFLLIEGVGCFVKECMIGWSAWFPWNPKLLVRYFFVIGFVSPTVLSPIEIDCFVIKE